MWFYGASPFDSWHGEDEEDAAEGELTSARSGEASNGAKSAATATPPRWSPQSAGVGLDPVKAGGKGRGE